MVLDRVLVFESLDPRVNLEGGGCEGSAATACPRKQISALRMRLDLRFLDCLAVALVAATAEWFMVNMCGNPIDALISCPQKTKLT